MKNLFLCSPLLMCLFLSLSFESCTTDSSFETESSINRDTEIKGNTRPANKNNPYDSVGQIYNELPVSAESINSIIATNKSSIDQIIGRTELSVTAKSSFNTFINDLLLLLDQGQQYEAIYSFIADYESDVLHDNALNERDKEIILSSSSAARFTIYAEAIDPPKKDPEWSVLITSIAIGEKANPLITLLATTIVEKQ